MRVTEPGLRGASHGKCTAPEPKRIIRGVHLLDMDDVCQAVTAIPFWSEIADSQYVTLFS